MASHGPPRAIAGPASAMGLLAAVSASAAWRTGSGSASDAGDGGLLRRQRRAGSDFRLQQIDGKGDVHRPRPAGAGYAEGPR